MFGHTMSPSPRTQVERERQVLEGQTELKSVLARYRGPLLEATIDLEQRIYHLLVQADGSGSIINPEEEVVYSLFTLAQVGRGRLWGSCSSAILVAINRGNGLMDQ